MTEIPDIWEVFGFDGSVADEQNDASSEKPAKRGTGKRGLGKKTIVLRAAIQKLRPLYKRMTVRQIFYRMEVAGLVPKDSGYEPVQRQVAAMRRDGSLPWEFIADATRWQRKPSSWDDKDDYLRDVARGYRRDLWRSQGIRIEIWLEKDALASVIVDTTEAWDVALMVSRGQSSMTFLHAAAMEAQAAYEADGTATFVYSLYDYDLGGERANAAIERDLSTHAPGVPITFKRLAVTPAQIKKWSLPTRDPSKDKKQLKVWPFSKKCCDLDAIDPNDLIKLVENAIISHIDARSWEIEQAIEAEERAGLESLTEGRS